MIQVIGYVELNGTKTFSDEVLAAIYSKLKEQGILNIVFSDDPINNSAEFIHFMKILGNYPAIILVDNNIMGIGWLNGVGRNNAFAHYAFFKESWGKQTINMAHALMDYWFSFKHPTTGDHMLDVLIGQTPVWNKKAVKFLERIGWTKLTPPIPCISKTGVVISYITRENHGQKK